MPTRPPSAEASRAAAEIDVVPVDHVRGGGTRLLPRSSILYLQAYGDYMRIYSEEGRFLLFNCAHCGVRRTLVEKSG